ncbi:MAG: hypothetical protein LUH22_12200 [Bacteroides sp.]|nr:hypothetical protein [Bacteroides sp.]
MKSPLFRVWRSPRMNTCAAQVYGLALRKFPEERSPSIKTGAAPVFEVLTFFSFFLLEAKEKSSVPDNRMGTNLYLVLILLK